MVLLISLVIMLVYIAISGNDSYTAELFVNVEQFVNLFMCCFFAAVIMMLLIYSRLPDTVFDIICIFVR